MKNHIIALVVFISILTPPVAYNQIDGMGKFLASGIEDGEKLIEGYLSPWINAFGASLTGGWYNTAKPHQLGGFDITATMNAAFVPSSDQTFDVGSLGLQNLVLDDPDNSMSPTIAGKDDFGPLLNYNVPTNPSAFTMPKGTGWRYIPSPMIQIGVGLIKDTEIMGRFMPKVSAGKNNEIKMWGIGFKHGLKQWLPFIEKVPVLHLTVMGGYTKMNSSLGIKVNPEIVGLGSFNVVDQNGNTVADPDWDDQKMELETGSFTGNLIVSANLSVVCFYGGLGFATSKTNIKMKGNYPVLGFDIDGVTPVVLQTPDPIDMEIKFKDGNTTKPRLNAGVRFKFAVVTLHFDYTWASYSMATAGLGISFR